jgi:hypothetical protein
MGRGWDRGLRGIEFDGDQIYIAASDELFVYNRKFEQIASYRSPYLKHCHEISRYQRRLYLTSTGFDTILGFDLDSKQFSLGFKISRTERGFETTPFNPQEQKGPSLGNELHLNNICCLERGMYISGMRTEGLLKFTGTRIVVTASLPRGTHNARPHRGGVLFNDSSKNALRFATPDTNRVFAVPYYDPSQLTHTDLDDSRIARQAFARGLCLIDDGVVAAGSSPSTITLHDLNSMKTTLSINLTMDIRNAIHGLEVWPYPVTG